eukprot:COSAG05_NODE_7204_length_843_cov_0.557796_1_plen_243_part_01
MSQTAMCRGARTDASRLDWQPRRVAALASYPSLREEASAGQRQRARRGPAQCFRDATTHGSHGIAREHAERPPGVHACAPLSASESTRKPLLHTRGISQARSFDLEVTPWAPSRLTSCIFHPGPEESSGASTLPAGPAKPPFRLKLPPESARKPLLHTRGISRARSFDLEVTPWAPTRLTSCISHPGPEESSGASTLAAGPTEPPFRLKLPPESARKPLLHTRGISQARSFDLEVTPWAPTRL